jgi:exodeoxyribonuclease-3
MLKRSITFSVEKGDAELDNGETKSLKRRKTAPSKSSDVADAGLGKGVRPKDSISETPTRPPHVRDEIIPLPVPENLNTLKIISWNVNGLKALVSSKLDTLAKLIATQKPDILCLQETKIQEQAIPEFVNLLDGYWSFWSCSSVKKGYSGTVRQ